MSNGAVRNRGLLLPLAAATVAGAFAPAKGDEPVRPDLVADVDATLVEVGRSRALVFRLAAPAPTDAEWTAVVDDPACVTVSGAK